MLGILGGMGPLATVDLMRKIIERTPAAGDAGHLPMLVANFTHIPNRLAAWKRGDDLALVSMIAALKTLEAGGANLLVIACNTAHLWFDAMQKSTRIPIMHIADAAVAQLLRQRRPIRKIGLLATEPTLEGRLYHDRLERAGFVTLTPDSTTQRTSVNVAIDAVKGNDLATARAAACTGAAALMADGAECIILACTEMPLALEGSEFEQHAIDPALALAEECVLWWLQRRASE